MTTASFQWSLAVGAGVAAFAQGFMLWQGQQAACWELLAHSPPAPRKPLLALE